MLALELEQCKKLKDIETFRAQQEYKRALRDSKVCVCVCACACACMGVWALAGVCHHGVCVCVVTRCILLKHQSA